VADSSRIGERYLGRYLVWHTSGSTGDPVVLVHDQEAVLVYRALEIARAVPMWLSWGDLGTIARRRGRVAVLGSIDGHYADTVWAACARRDHPWRRRNTRMMSVRRPLMGLVQELNSFQPVVVFGYSTMLGVLAEEQEAERLFIRPTMICTGAEPLPRTMRARIEQAFGCPVRETYGCSEALTLAYGCAQGWLHPNTDWMIIEPVDRFSRPTPPGRFSHSVLITNLANRVQPILRYDLGDRVLVSPEPCTCGSPLPAIHVEGRTDDILAVQAPDGTTVHLIPLALTAANEETPSVRRYQVIQSTPVRLVVRLEAVPPADERAVWSDVHERLRSYLREQGLPNVILELAEDSPAPDPRRGKFRHVWSELRE
jgi:phenylacetate-coenzyme A ligase PaaK-like adenylate-forming protein